MKLLLFLPIYYALSCYTIPFVTTLFIPQETTPPPPEPSPQNVISVFNHTLNSTYDMSIEEYLVGVVAAEMPAAFEEEALKAQSVAARTYTMYKSASSDHEADICTDFAHCQAYLSNEEMHSAWGTDYDFYHNKIKSAVYSTQGEYITYNEEPIMAVFHSMGGGRTENCSDVWGNDIPYLTSVSSPGEDVAANYHSTVTISFEDFKNKILSQYPNAVISSYLDISEPVLTSGAHVKSMLIGGITIPGPTLRKLFDLRSTKFDISFSGDNVIFSVTGYGHGVGMSQYGANAMAKEGKTYKEILLHYYQGVTLSS